jgi:hypothetical protein
MAAGASGMQVIERILVQPLPSAFPAWYLASTQLPRSSPLVIVDRQQHAAGSALHKARAHRQVIQAFKGVRRQSMCLYGMRPTCLCDLCVPYVPCRHNVHQCTVGALLSQVTALTSQLSGVRVLCVNYRLAPQHPFPAGLDDALAVYMALVTAKGYKPASIGMIGDSAGEE